MGIPKPITADRIEAFRQRVALADPADPLVTVDDGEDDVQVDPAHMPGDPIALRGIPVVGGPAGGAIGGTRPGDPVWRLEKDERYLRRPRPKRT